MLRLFIFTSIFVLTSCIRVKKNDCCLSDQLTDPVTKNTNHMSDFLQRFDVTVVGVTESRGDFNELDAENFCRLVLQILLQRRI